MKISKDYAALFIDFENIFHYIRKRTVDSERAQDIVIELIQELRKKLSADFAQSCIVQYAYADFEQIEVNAQGQLFLLGVETRNVVGTEHKNAADMRLCIDVMETMYTRDEIDTFVLMAGDRDYIPVLQHLRKHAKVVQVVAFKENISGDLLTLVSDGFIDAMQCLGKVSQSELEVGQERLNEYFELRAEASNEQAIQIAEARANGKVAQVAFERSSRLVEKDAQIALEVMLHNFGDKPEVWFTPYLNKLRNALQHLAEYERKALVTTLEMHGAVKVEKRRGEPHDYSVIVINWDHPDVREMNPVNI
ncbi:MAG: NYN domain-containing protein [Armatimonadetes bacterium]|nr:NYN domain-containing protein [Armatimonadota bacterium]MBS1702341.1 NYN domain-containing protein [Armatimonadota bacterium]MBS1726331.1 NYN domain-containing protein [Armatimonadota bacterium]